MVSSLFQSTQAAYKTTSQAKIFLLHDIIAMFILTHLLIIYYYPCEGYIGLDRRHLCLAVRS